MVNGVEMYFSKKKMVERVTAEGKADMLDEATLKTMDNLDGQPVTTASWQRVVNNMPVYSCTGKDGEVLPVFEGDCVYANELDINKTFDISVTVNAKLTAEDIDNIMSTALEGGVDYWCDSCNVVGKYLGEYAGDQISRGGKLTFYISEEFECDENGTAIHYYTLDQESFFNGLRAVLAAHNDLIADGAVDVCNIDADIADQIIQYALFNDVVFG